jgi:DNA polymerase-3 subunit epsilon
MISCIDLETTGTDATHDRIVSLGIVRIDPMTWTVGKVNEYRFNPQVEMKPEVVAIHGITNEMASAYPLFKWYAHDIYKALDGENIAGFNLLGLDLPILWNEFHRCGIEWKPFERNIIDAGTLFKKREERTLSAAVKFYLGREHKDAHSAGCDALETANVLVAQMERYKLTEMPLPLIEEESLFSKPVDVAGKIVVGPDGRPTYTFQRVKGVAVEDDPGFGEWMMTKDFHPDTLRVVAELIGYKAPSDDDDDYDDQEMPT